MDNMVEVVVVEHERDINAADEDALTVINGLVVTCYSLLFWSSILLCSLSFVLA